RIVACDVTDHAAMSGLIDDIRAAGGLAGVVHAAGIWDETPIDSIEPGDFSAVWEAKAGSAVRLDELTRELDLSVFVVFSSIAGVLGSARHAAYAAANAALDGLIEQRRAAGLAGTAVAWGPWAGGGMATAEADSATRLSRTGNVPMAPEFALAALDDAMANDRGTCMVADLRWDLFGPAYRTVRPSPLTDDIVRESSSREEPTFTGSALLERATGLPSADQERLILEHVRAQAAKVLGHLKPDAVVADQNFRDLGFDSLMAVELRNSLSAVLGMPLPATLTYDHPTPLGLATHIRKRLLPEQPGQVDHLLAELDRIELALADVPAGKRALVDVRLAALVATWNGTDDDSTGTSDISAATRDELFDILHTEFGRS
ncbi:beta-ketoacyl reductase, partial [Polymorphospora rubra]|uniref:beta-ketoacyl reductase n=1 Tax=Polymorphospora rubra TaxID=338584 RepID=UPI0033C2F6DE